jgi:hypothetical protein
MIQIPTTRFIPCMLLKIDRPAFDSAYRKPQTYFYSASHTTTACMRLVSYTQ